MEPALSPEDQALFDAHIWKARMVCNHCKADTVPLFGGAGIENDHHSFLMLCKTCAIAQRKKMEAHWLAEKKKKKKSQQKKKRAPVKLSL